MSGHPHRFKVGDKVKFKPTYYPYFMSDIQRVQVFTVAGYPDRYNPPNTRAYRTAVLELQEQIDGQLFFDDNFDLAMTPMQQYFEATKATLL